MVGETLDRYRIESKLGEGGMGVVYKALDPQLDRTVAIKVIRRDLTPDPDRLERFAREARSASALNHPNIVTIHDFGVEDGTSYIAMEWVDGSSLRDLVASGKPQPPLVVADTGAQIADGLARAHAAGIVHRDLKPDNVMLTSDGRVKILDFGLAKLVPAVADVGSTLATQSGGTAAGVLLGTVGYMSPEQAVGAAVDFRSDQFALGVILYELATGSRAFKRDSAPQTLAAIIEDDPEPVQARNPRVPQPLARIIARAMAKKPAERYGSTQDLARDLKDLVRDSSASQPAIAPARRTSSRTLILASAAALLLIIGAVSWWAIAGRGRDTAADDMRRVVAVLPFRDLTGDPDRTYFASGVTDEIRGQLVRVSALRVLSRSAAQRYGDADIPRLRSELGAGSALEGSVRLDGQRVRVAVELVDTSTEQTIWSEQYDRTVDDVLSVQSEVAMRIASALNATLTSAEQAHVAQPPTANPKAYEVYLRAQGLSSGERQQNLRSIALYREALQLDPSFALAQAKLAYRLFFQSYFDDPKYVDLGIEAALRAIEMDASLPAGYFALASAYGHKGWATKSRAAFQKAAELDPGDTTSLNNLAVLESEVLGRHDEAIGWVRRRMQATPFDQGSAYHLSWPLLFIRDDATTERWLSESERRFPRSPRLKYLRAALRYLQGDEAGALTAIRQVLDESPAYEEALLVSAELAFLTKASDAEAQIERMSRRAPGLLSGQLLKPESHRTSLAWLLLQRGDRSRAATLLSEALEVAQAELAGGNENQRVPFEIAAIHMARGERDAALDWLDKAVAAGYGDYSTLARHPIFEPVRRQPRFQTALATMEKNIKAMRERSAVLAELRTMPFPETPARKGR
ncbi:MAG TPA: protein kinase [Vicinamibacterales bacterium]